MIINNINNIPFEARIKINKPKLEAKFLKTAGSSSVMGGSSSVLTGASSGADMIVHGSDSAIPAMQTSSSLFDQFADYGHKIFDIFSKNGYEHNAYDASFFSAMMSGSGGFSYYEGMNTIVKGIEKNYKNKIPT